MADDQKFLPILGYGERLIEPVRRGTGGGEPTFPRSFEEARELLTTQINTVRGSISHIPQEKRMDEVVLTVRLNHKFLAKSYTPYTFFRDAGFENVGSRRWVTEEGEEQVLSKLHFVKTNEQDLQRLTGLLTDQGATFTESFKKDIQKIDEISLLAPEEKILGFEDGWQEGKVEMVLHPFGENDIKVVDKLKALLLGNGVDESTLRIKAYPNGPTFISCFVTSQAIQAIEDFNPLRTVHPIRMDPFPEMRDLGAAPDAPSPITPTHRSRVKVGVFDGGIDLTNPLIANFATEGRSIGTTALAEGIRHGTAVAGAVLYGPLNSLSGGSIVPQPTVTVEGFRVLPTVNPRDFELYEAIDLIEEIVPVRNDIQVYNISLGPRGPILDDDITRFTYALDDLAWNYKKLFVIAVGNDGELAEPLNRIQAPSDMVNGLGVGAYSYDFTSGEITKASYSCVGQGREGCKVKPDVLAFGGDSNCPIHLVSSVDPTKKFLSAGTSFAAPIIAGKAGEILGRCDLFNPLIARALIIHSANHPEHADSEMGYGIVEQSVDEMLYCTDKHVTIVYSSSIRPTTLAKLPIPFPINASNAGTVNISWTIAVLSKTNPLHAEDYTQSAIEDTFYPHSRKFPYSLGSQRKIKHIDNDAAEITRLLAEGWRAGSLPASRSPVSYQTEQARRGELKWDTVVRKQDSLRYTTLHNPFLVLHGMDRNDGIERMDYAVVITLSAPRYQGNLYEDILAEYRQLEPIQVRNVNEIMIPV